MKVSLSDFDKNGIAIVVDEVEGHTFQFTYKLISVTEKYFSCDILESKEIIHEALTA